MNELALFENPQTLERLSSFAERIAQSELVPASLRKKPNDIFIVLMTGLELGLPTMACLSQISIVQGRPVMSAALCRSLAMKHKDCVKFECVEQTDTIATWVTIRGNGGEQRISFTIEQAKKAGLTQKDNWVKYPAQMLSARASAILARNAYSDALAGVYIDDEAEDFKEAQPAQQAPRSARDVIVQSTATTKPTPPVLQPVPSIESATTAPHTPLQVAAQQLRDVAEKVQAVTGGQIEIEGSIYRIATGVKKGATLTELDDGALLFYAKGKGADAMAAKAELDRRKA